MFRKSMGGSIWLLTVPVGFVETVMMLLFTILLCLLIYNAKNARIDRRALIEVTVTYCIFLVAFFIVIIPVIILSLVVPKFTPLFIPITAILTPLTLLLAIHLPFSSMIARLCRKHPYSHTSGECDRTTVHRSTNWHQPSHTTWNPPHSFNEASEIIPFVRDMQ